ncbi:MAG: isopenicillin N synthase family dioxygenase [Myxococcota bacterium]
MKILDVDLLAFERGDRRQRRAVIAGVMESLATGFVYLEHDLPESDLDACYSALGDFFALPLADKNRWIAEGSRGQRGYTGLMVETAASASVADWKEMLNWGDTAPAGHPLGMRYPDRYAAPLLPEGDLPGITSLLMNFHRQTLALQTRFLRIVAEGLSAHADFFDPLVRHGATLTRAVHYPAMQAAPNDDSTPPIWAAEHGDINLVTALPRATAPGLQVKTKEGWIDAAPPPGAAVINTGIMLEHLSNGRLPTGIHRVIARPDQKGPRLSVVQFCHPTPSTILAPMPSCVSAETPQRFGAISAADRLDEVLWEINLSS